jgi:hypothetical protein
MAMNNETYFKLFTTLHALQGQLGFILMWWGVTILFSVWLTIQPYWHVASSVARDDTRL